MNLVSLSMRRPVTVSMATVALIVFGLVLFGRLGLTLLPDLSYPTLTVRTQYTGAAPSEVEHLISKPIEEAVGVIKNVRSVRSVSRAGQSDVLIEFDWGVDMSMAGIDVREKLDIVQLPLDVERPSLLRFNPSLDPILRLSLSRGGADAKQLNAEQTLISLRRLADEQIKKHLESIEGVAAVKISGGFEDEVQINIDQEKLAQLKLTPEQVAAHLKSENINLSGGRLEEGSQQYLVRTINQYASIEEMAGTIIANVNGKPVLLGDVAEVRMHYRERDAISRINGTEAVEIALYKEGDANTVKVAKSVKSGIESLQKSIGETNKLDVIYDQSVFIENAVSEVVDAGLQGGLLAVIVLYLFLRNIWATLVIAISIPVGVVIAFNLMYAWDITLNIMSLGGLALSIGMLIDNGVVVLENIDRHKQLGKDQREAAEQGTREVAGALTASTLTSVAVFLPLVFVEGIAGQLFRDQALTVTFSQLVSLLVGFTLMPMLAVAGAPKSDTQTALINAVPAPKRRINIAAPMLAGLLWVFAKIGRACGWVFRPLANGFNWCYHRVEQRYAGLLRWALAHRALILLVASGLFATSVMLLQRMGVELIPQLAQGEFVAHLRTAPGTPLAKTDALLQQAHAIAAARPEVERSFAVAGTGNRLDASPDKGGENVGELNIVLKKPVTTATETLVMRELRDALAQIPGVQVQVEHRSLFTFKTPLEVIVIGYDLGALKTTADEVVAKLRGNDRFIDIRSSIENGHPELQIHFDHERASKLGLSVPDVANQVAKKLRGDIATRYAFRDRKVNVVVRLGESARDSVEEVSQLIVFADGTRTVPLSAVADIRQSIGPSEITRIAQERVAVIATNLRYGDLGEGAAALQNLLDTLPERNGIDIQVSGQNEEMQTSFDSMKMALGLALFLVYLVMASQFESLLHPFVIMFTVPLALVGATFALVLTGQHISVVVFIGLIMLAGIVVNNAIVLIDRINQLRSEGQQKMAALHEAGKTRLRPIMMTMLTTVLGMLPLALGFGEGAEIRAPMAITVIGGILVSTLLTLLVIPVLYSLIDRSE